MKKSCKIYYFLKNFENHTYNAKTSGASMVVLIKRAVEVLLVDDEVKLWPKDFGLNPLLDPFPAEVAAKILLIDQSTLAELAQNYFINATCRVGDADRTYFDYFSYWDILEATTFMSLVSIGDNVDRALEDASLICDLLAYYYEENRKNGAIDVLLLADIIKDHINTDELVNRFPEIGLPNVSLKLAIDIMNVHSRCLNNFAKQALLCSSRPPSINVASSSLRG